MSDGWFDVALFYDVWSVCLKCSTPSRVLYKNLYGLIGIFLCILIEANGSPGIAGGSAI
jgi:hypothetical protein